MTQREIAETLRNPNGPYFAEGTPAFVALETMVDTAGLRNVMYALLSICDAKVDHLRANYQDVATASLWQHASAKICKAAATICTGPE